ncbi:MAG: hypothetical protein SWK76_04745 [Actinomycetota bacterium]|nr:hypothetical protein [Actinomycetota bacterium]
MKWFKGFFTAAIVALVPVLLLAGCLGAGGEAKAKADEAVDIIAAARPLMEDLINLDNRFNTLGTRYTSIDDTITEGKSLVDMALIDVDELESRYFQASGLLVEVADMGDVGDYATYAELALQALEESLQALRLNRELLNTVSDMLDVLPHAESEEQLSYYVDEIELLNQEITAELDAAAASAADADLYYEEHGL